MLKLLLAQRDIEPEVASLPNIYLYTVDDLNEVITENMAGRKQAAKQAESIISLQTNDFMSWLDSLNHEPLMRALRLQTQELTQDELEKSLRRLDAGEQAEEVLKQFAHALSQKFLHQPTTEINDSNDSNIVTAAHKLFGIPTSVTTTANADNVEKLDKQNKKH